MIAPTHDTFSLSRKAEFFSEDELTKQIGYRRDLWLLAIVKELIDNSLDSCEELGILPEVSVKLADAFLSVRDNGAGIPPETVVAMFDFSKRVSSREAYRSPSRGQQGNAGKCILGCPYVLNGERGRVTIVAKGWRHDITVALDKLAQEPRVDHHRTEEKVQTGTLVEVHIDELASILDEDEIDRFVLFAQSYAALNPHLSLLLESPDGECHEWPRTSEKINKWTPASPEPPCWYNLEAFERLVGASISRDRENGTNRPLRDFLRQFAGLRRSDALKAVADATGLTRCNLSELANCSGLDRQKTASLLEAMQQNGQTPKPQKLGCVGRSHVEHVFAQIGISGGIKYKKIVDHNDNGLPFVVEVAFAELESPSDSIVITGCNYTPSIDLPVARDLDWLLRRQMIDDESSVVLLVHIATVAPTYLDRGKSHIDVQGALEEAIEQCLVSTTASYRRQRKAEERDAARRERRIERSARSRPDITLKDAIINVLPEAIHNASGGGVCDFSDRDLYYAARELVQNYTDQPLTQSYFDKVVDNWEKDHELIPGRLRDPRGFLQEPHTRVRIPLGTKAVDEYEIPAHLYDTIIYVEKKGLLAKFELGQIGELYDTAIICAEGYAVRAAKALIHAAQKGHKMTVLCIHDADPHGNNIARTLSESTGAHHYNIKIIDAGLSLAEALDMGLSVETFVRKKALPKGLKLTDLELEYFTGTPKNVVGKNGKMKLEWINCRRVELNALSADPERFVAWIKAKLAEHGVAKKLVPPKKVIASQATRAWDSDLQQSIHREIEESLDIDNAVDQIAGLLSSRAKFDTVPALVKNWAKNPKPEHWTQFVKTEVSKQVRKLDKAIRAEVKKVFQQ